MPEIDITGIINLSNTVGLMDKPMSKYWGGVGAQ